MLALIGKQNEHDSLATMRHHRTLARVSVIQAMTASELKTKYGEGSLVLVSGEKALCKVGERVSLVPLLFFDEYISWNDRKDKASPMIEAKSFDPASLVGSKALDPKRWEEKYGAKNEFLRRNSHHLNFVCVVYGEHELQGMPVTLSYSRGGFRKGKALIDAIKMRRIQGQQVPLYGCVFSFAPEVARDREGHEYWVAGFRNPDAPASPWISPEHAPIAEALHKELLKDYLSRDLSVKHEEAVAAEGGDSDGIARDDSPNGAAPF
jgi:hypothetical protein